MTLAPKSRNKFSAFLSLLQAWAKTNKQAKFRMPKCCRGHAYTEKVLIVYLKFKFTWVSCILSGNLILSESNLPNMSHSWLLWQMIAAISLGEQIDKAQKKRQIDEICVSFMCQMESVTQAATTCGAGGRGARFRIEETVVQGHDTPLQGWVSTKLMKLKLQDLSLAWAGSPNFISFLL